MSRLIKQIDHLFTKISKLSHKVCLARGAVILIWMSSTLKMKE